MNSVNKLMLYCYCIVTILGCKRYFDSLKREIIENTRVSNILCGRSHNFHRNEDAMLLVVLLMFPRLSWFVPWSVCCYSCEHVESG